MPDPVPITEAADARPPHHSLWHLGSQLQWASIDAVVAFASMSAAFRLTPAAHAIASVETHIRPLPAAIMFAVAAFISSYALGLGRLANLRSRARIVLLLLLLTFAAMGGALLLVAFISYKQIGRYIVAICALAFFAVEACLRLAWRGKIITATHRIVVLSDGTFSRQLRDLAATAVFPVEIAAIIQPDPAAVSSLETALSGHRVHEIVVHHAGSNFDPRLLSALDHGIAVSTMDAFAERHFTRVPCDFINPGWFFRIDLRQHHPFYYGTKRLLDVGLSFLAGLITAPVVVAAAIAIKLESRGPALYSQVRVGRQQQPFVIWKLRTMQVDSEATGPQWASKGDARVTRIGRILRQTRIDEIPQFWNVLRGDMALVGPRPERPEFVDQLAASIPFYRQRHLVKPGLTGWAQICYRYGSSEDDAREKLSYDFYYLKNASVLLDFQILLQTLGAVMRGSR